MRPKSTMRLLVKNNELYELNRLNAQIFRVNRGPSGSTSPLRRLRSHSIGQANPRRGAELLQSREGRFHRRHQPGHDQGQRRRLCHSRPL